jgi:hypothetical protein
MPGQAVAQKAHHNFIVAGIIGHYTLAFVLAVRTLSLRLKFAAFVGSGLVRQSQKMTVAASATAEKRTVGQRRNDW